MVGFAGAKLKVLTKPILEGVMKLIVKILLPCLIFTVVAGSGVTAKDYLANGGICARDIDLLCGAVPERSWGWKAVSPEGQNI